MSFAFLKKIFTFSYAYKNFAIVYLLASLIVAFCDIAVGYFIKVLTDSTIEGKQSIWGYIGLFLLVTVIGTACKYTARYFSGRFSATYIQNLRDLISHHISKLSISDRNQTNSGEFVSKITNDINQIQQFIQSTFFQLAYQPLVFLLAFSFLAWLNWSLVIVTLIAVPFTLLLANKISRPIKKYREQESKVQSEIISIAQDSISGIHTEKAYNLQGIINKKFADSVGEWVSYMVKREKRQALLTPFQMIIHVIPLLICSIFGGYLAIKGELSTGELFAFVFLIQYLIDPLAMIPNIFGEMRTAEASLSRIEEVMRLPVERDGGLAVDLNNKHPLIEFSGVYFEYDQGINVLNDLSFAVGDKQMVALVGASGSGKSTVFNLLCGHYEPSKGQIKIGGADLNALDLEQVRSLFSIVSQETYLFPGSIAENISYGKPDSTMDEIVHAAKLALIHEFIMKLPEGYQTIVGERGYRLSGGQKQRLSIARAILKKAPILLLDEATSALDTELEARVQQNLLAYVENCSILAIAHRLSTIIHADQILVFDQGSIVERGTHEELLQTGRRYKELYQRQFVEQANGYKEAAL